MEIKVTGHIDELSFLHEVIKRADSIIKKDGPELFLEGATIYLNYKDAQGRIYDYTDKNGNVLYIPVTLPDRFALDVAERLEQGMKQVTIAAELGISPNRVSKIKKYLLLKGII
ncbi:hypothetical protein P4679_33210 [Priestia megaterium]|uniref:hypothetical protein n=1 Tax=Priestia megaterium TaxID=1404 RepID=UPI002E1FB674|nr:hypothetical protein [Priestia megaterium]